METHDPTGFTPRSGICPFWLHTIDLDPTEALFGVVAVIDQKYLTAVAQLLGYDLDAVHAMVVHTLGEERWLRLSRMEAIQLRLGLGQMNDFDARLIPGAYNALALVDYIVESEV